MSPKQLLGLALVVLLSVLATRFLWPAEREVRLPAKTDTVRVTETKLDSIIEERIVFRDQVTTDTVNVVQTRFITEVDTVFLLPSRWYLDWATIASRGDTSRFGMVELGGDSTGIFRRRQVEEHVTLGPVREIRTDTAGLHVDYGEPPRGGVKLPFGLNVPTELVCGAGAAGGFVLGVAMP